MSLPPNFRSFLGLNQGGWLAKWAALCVNFQSGCNKIFGITALFKDAAIKHSLDVTAYMVMHQIVKVFVSSFIICVCMHRSAFYPSEFCPLLINWRSQVCTLSDPS